MFRYYWTDVNTQRRDRRSAMAVWGKQKTAQASDLSLRCGLRGCFGDRRKGIENFRSDGNLWRIGRREPRYGNASLHSLDQPRPLVGEERGMRGQNDREWWQNCCAHFAGWVKSLRCSCLHTFGTCDAWRTTMYLLVRCGELSSGVEGRIPIGQGIGRRRS